MILLGIAALAHLAQSAFVSGMDLAMLTGAVVALGGCLLALAVLPARPAATAIPRTERPGHASGHVHRRWRR